MQTQYRAGGFRHAGWLLAGLLAAAAVVLLLLPAPVVRALFWEGGPVERLTEVLYVAAAVVVVAFRAPERGAVALRLATALLLLAACAREADWHKHWTGTSVLRVSYYYGNAPADQRIAAALVVGLVLVAAGHLVWRAWRGWWPAMRRGEPHAASVAVLVAALVAGKLADRSRAVLAESFGMAMGERTAALVRVLEETFELALPLLALLAVVQYFAPSAPTPPPR